MDETLPPSAIGHDDDAAGIPGLVLVFWRGDAVARAMPLVSLSAGNGELELGRATIEDGRISRRHAVVRFDGKAFTATDVGSQNGTFADGRPLVAHETMPLSRVLRVGDSLLVPCRDVAPFERTSVRAVDGFVRGPAMQILLEDVARAATGTVLHVRGESGTGKEGIALAFHRAGPRAGGPFVAVNCAAIPHGLAERLLFGARRGAYSGADHDATGYLQDADGGTLFLDEVAELDAQVQAKLLRALESREVTPLGASKPRRVELGLCSATNKDLRALVAAGALREDLFFRVGRPMVALPPLRDRPEEIAALVVSACAESAIHAHVSLVEQCLLRAWPGNIRELLAEIRAAASAARVDGDRVMGKHLAPSAGSAFSQVDAPTVESIEPPRKRAPPVVDDAWRQRIEDALRANGGKVAAAARALGLHRTQLRRMIERNGIAVAPDDPGDD